MDEDPLALELQEHTFSSKNDVHNSIEIYETPTKKLKEAVEVTPANRRKSILKSSTTKLGKYLHYELKLF